MKKGTLYGIGVGPGDPKLLTLKAVEIISACPVVAAPVVGSGRTTALDIAAQAVELSGKKQLMLPTLMQKDAAKLEESHQKAAALLRQELDAGHDVAVLNLGDISIYASFAYWKNILEKEGYSAVMVPGIPSFCAVAAELGISLTTMDSPLHIIPADTEALAPCLDLKGTKILMKSGRKLEGVIAELKERGKLSTSAMVQNCGLPGQRIVRELDREEYDKEAYFSTLVVKG
ncbi:precorrin-2 C(20)-methyltransferase [Oscillospiraceae bacterium MB08-C2-2]|nr:precorrin-2 C(20)-methyltransferase [Oscillospiraceae bacterium MB08-C2-2]